MPKPAFVTIQEMWENFEKACIEPSAGITQRSEMKIAFFAGAWSFFSAQMALASYASNEDAEENLVLWAQELKDFGDNNAIKRFDPRTRRES